MPLSSLDLVKRGVLAHLRERQYAAQKINELGKSLGIASGGEEHDVLRLALAELEASGEIRRIERRRYVLGSTPSRITGTLVVTRGGTGFVEASDGATDDVMVRPTDMGTAMHGDQVRVRLIASRQYERPMGEVVEVISRETHTLVGTLMRRGSFFVVAPDDRRFVHDVYVATRAVGASRVGDKVVVNLKPWEDPLSNPEGEIIENLGRAGEPRVEIAATARQHGVASTFPGDATAEAERAPAVIDEAEARQRLDLRDTVVFTIDPDDARDFDDAISLRALPDGNVELGVHIADVSHFVRAGSALDNEALRRGTSVYLVNGVTPMLPERLSNDLCSLRPDEDRLTYSAIMTVTPRGRVTEYAIRKSIIRSRRRFTYDEALERIESGVGDFATELQAMHAAAQILTKKRHREGGIDFETPEVKFKFDEKGYPIEIIPKRRNKATRLIEEFMLLANNTVAQHVTTLGRTREATVHPFLYRVHDSPRKERLAELAVFVKRFGHTLETDNIRPQAIQRLLESVRGTPEELLINELTLRAMAKAVYSEHNIGHFGLASKWYTHFTSPIRRYPDLIVHRLLDEYEHGMSSARRIEYKNSLGQLADWCSQCEQRAVEAERESVKIAQAEYILRHVGDEMDGMISGVQRYGIFVKLKDIFTEGLVSIRNIEGDNYYFDDRNFALVGRSSKRMLRLGDPIRVRIVRVNRERHEVDLELVETDVRRPRSHDRGGRAASQSRPAQSNEPPKSHGKRNGPPAANSAPSTGARSRRRGRSSR